MEIFAWKRVRMVGSWEWLRIVEIYSRFVVLESDDFLRRFKVSKEILNIQWTDTDF